MTKKVILFGEVLLRLAAPSYAKLFQKDILEASFCGAEANAAVSLSVFGLKSQLVTKLPANDVGRSAADALRYFGVDISRIVYGDGRMGLYYLEKGVSQRPSRIIYDRAYSSMTFAKPEDFDWNAILDGSDWFHWTGITPALSENLSEICLEACKFAKNKKIPISCDMNFRSALWSPERAKITMESLMPYVDVCIGNEEDADRMLGIHAQGSNVQSGIVNADGYNSVAKEICERYACQYAAFTLRESYSASRNGWSAMLYCSDTETTCLSRKYDIQIVDRVGGGDSFAAGLIYGFLSDMDDQETVDFAAAASCLKQTMEGDFNRSTVADVKDLLACGGNGRIKR